MEIGRHTDIVASAMDAIVAIDETHRIIVFNGAAEKMFGHRAAEMIGKPLDLLIPERFRARHKAHIERFSATGETSRRLGELGEVVGLRASAEEFLVEASISQTGSSPNKIFTAFLRDITERKRAELVLRASELRLEGVIASVAEGIISVDSDFRIVLFNPAAEHMFGRSREEMTGQPLGALIPERFRAQHEEHMRAFAATGKTSRSMGQYGVIHGLRAGREEFPIEATISQTGTGRNKLFTVILRDVTERLRAEQALRDLTEQLRRLSRQLLETEENERHRLARELHDRIGQNVTALTLNLNLVRGKLPAESLQSIGAHLSDCETLLYSTGQLIRDVMSELRPPGLDQLGLLAALTEHARQLAGRSGLSATVSGTEIIPRLPPQSEIMLFRIAQEALMNVVKHARATDVTVALEANPDLIVMTVSDNGCGFDPAARLARTEVTASLGLVGMRERAEAIGGRLRIESAPGKGTRVIVEAPRVPPTPWPQRVPGRSSA